MKTDGHFELSYDFLGRPGTGLGMGWDKLVLSHPIPSHAWDGMGWDGLFEMLYPMGLYRPKSHYDCKMKYALACNFIACKHACNIPIQRSRENLK